MRRSNGQETLNQLLAQVCHLHYSRARQLFDAIGLYRGQPPVLEALTEREGMTHGELADRLQITQPTMTKMLQRMEKAGFLTRRPDSDDLRVSRVYLTDAGRTAWAQMQSVWVQSEAETFARFTPEERILLRRFLFDIRENLQQAVGEPHNSL
jgi:MarR family transcriptional regulator, organic hydroperoxide resistance regulator